MNTIKAFWNKIPAPVQKWIKGLEVAVISGLISSLVTIPVADFSTKQGWAQFVAAEVAVMAGCVRLYMAQSPLQNVIVATEKKSELTDGNITLTKSETNVVSGPNSNAS